MKYSITIPNFRPATLNELLRSVRTRIRRKKEDRQIIGFSVLQAGIPAATAKRRVRMIVTLAPRMKECDEDNAWKSCLDALVMCKALVDDSPDWVETLPVEYVRGPQKATRIELEDVEKK